MNINMIVACNNLFYIGKDGYIPWYIKEDLQFFKQMTIGKGILMGRKTFDSLQKPLHDRLNLVLTSKADRPGTFTNIDEAVKFANTCVKELWVIGGEQVYRQALNLPKLQYVYITHVNNNIVGDARFPFDEMIVRFPKSYILYANNAFHIKKYYKDVYESR